MNGSAGIYSCLQPDSDWAPLLASGDLSHLPLIRLATYVTMGPVPPLPMPKMITLGWVTMVNHNQWTVPIKASQLVPAMKLVPPNDGSEAATGLSD